MNDGPFVKQCLAGVVDIDAIADFVARWHNGEGGESLAGFLGLTDPEYNLWVEQSAALPAILAARKHNLDLEVVLNDITAVPVFGRAMNRNVAEQVLEWVRNKTSA